MYKLPLTIYNIIVNKKQSTKEKEKMEYKEVQKLIKKINKRVATETITVSIFHVEYDISSVDLYEGEDVKGEEFQMILCYLMFNDEHNSHECDILINPDDFEDFLRGPFTRKKEFIFNVTQKVKDEEYIVPLIVIESSYKEAIKTLENTKTEEWVRYELEEVR
jgi:hypothetical protein